MTHALSSIHNASNFFPIRSENREKTPLQKRVAKVYATVNTIRSRIGTLIGTARTSMKAAIRLIPANSPHASRMAVVVSRSKFFNFFAFPFAVIGLVNGAKGVYENAKMGDFKGFGLTLAQEAADVLDIIDAMNTMVEAVADVVKLSPAAEAVVQGVAKPIPFLNLAAHSIGIGLKSYSIDACRKWLDKVRVMKDHVAKPDALLPLLGAAIGITSRDQEKIVARVDKVAKKQMWTADRVSAKVKKLTERKISNRERAFARSVSPVALEKMKEIQATKPEEIDTKKAEKLFQDMKTIMQRRIAFQAVGIARNLLMIGAIILLFTPLSPVAALVLLAFGIFWSLMMSYLEDKIIYRGMEHLKP